MATWIGQVRGELRTLPETLRQFREGVANLHQVSDDLTGVAANLRRVSEVLDAAGLGEATEALKRSGESFRTTVERFEEANDAFIDSMSWVPGAKDVLKPFRRQRP